MGIKKLNLVNLFIISAIVLIVGLFIFQIEVNQANAHEWLGCGGSYSYYCACSGLNLVCTETADDCNTVGGAGDHTHNNHRLCSPGSITTTKNDLTGGTTSFNFSTSQIEHPTSFQSYNFNLSNGQNYLISNITSGTYTITENPPSGTALDSISCTSDISPPQINVSGNSVTIQLRRLEDVSCTFNNIGCTSNAYQGCHNNDVYSFDSCDNPESLVQDCGAADSTTTSTYCSGDDVILETTTTAGSCSASTNSCTSSTSTSTAVLETCQYGCSGGACNPAPAAPTVSLSASPTSITVGDSTVLSWTSNNADSCLWSQGLSGSAPLSGNRTESPGSSITYEISCQNLGGIATDSVFVNVGALTCTRCSNNYSFSWAEWTDTDNDCNTHSGEPTIYTQDNSCSGINCGNGACENDGQNFETATNCPADCSVSPPPPPPPPAPSSYNLPCPFDDCSSIGAIWSNLCRRLILFATPIFIIMILVAAYDFLMGGANPQKIRRGKKTLQYGAIGYIILLLACFIPDIISTIL